MDETARLAGWLVLVGLMIAVSYLGRATEGKPDPNVLYQWSTAIGGIIQDGIVLVLVLALAGFSRQLLALRRPTSLLDAFKVVGVAIVAIYAFEVALQRPRPSRERAGAHAHRLAAGTCGGVRRERDRHLHVDPVRRGADLPRARLLAARAASAAGRRSSPSGSCSGSRTASSSRCRSSRRSAARSRGSARAPTASSPACSCTACSTWSRWWPPSPSTARFLSSASRRPRCALRARPRAVGARGALRRHVDARGRVGAADGHVHRHVRRPRPMPGASVTAKRGWAHRCSTCTAPAPSARR